MMPTSPPTSRDAIVGSILGTAVGDAIGLPYEGLSRRRGVRMLGEPTGHRFLFGRGMVSDDTEHTCLAAQALIASRGDPETFARHLARGLRWWLLGLPAGTGRATLRAAVKLWCGFSPDRSGVFSAGNGPAMRAAVLGAAVDDLDLLRTLVSQSTRLTHTDPKAEHGAWAVALAARHARSGRCDGAPYLAELRSTLAEKSADEFLPLIDRAVRSAAAREAPMVFADSLGLSRGVSGYVYHTVPVAIHAWLRHLRDLPSAVEGVVRCGGDTDTTAAIVGGVIGAGVGKAGIPADWLTRLFEWPRTIVWMERLGERLAEAMASQPVSVPRLSAVPLLGRNLVFLAVVLVHAGRRCLPPY
jgi:ADP-ribosylglycohydrolase